MTRATSILSATVVAITCAACAGGKQPLSATPAEPGASLWQEPSNLPSRDLFYGPWGREHAPDPNAVYTFVERKHSGINPGLTVRDAQGREWSVKQPFPGGLDDEPKVEVAVSRILSALGYHQPPVYHVPAFHLEDGSHTGIEIGGRFRLDDNEVLDEIGEWHWEENPFIGTKPYEGLLVILMMLNSTDLKNSNNSLYERRRGDTVDRLYVVRDLGAALGDTNRFVPRKGHPDGFERQPFILGVNNGYVDFDYGAWYAKLVRDRITPADVEWASNLVGRLSDRQWRDAFRAAGFEPDVAGRFIAKLKEKIEQGRTIGRARAN
jgi:hypothetical protein